MFNRRAFLRGAAAAGLVGAAWWTRRRPPVAGRIVGANSRQGHRLRDGEGFAAPSEKLKTRAVIVGGGIAGLSAAWRLRKKGFHDFVLLELDDHVGGNSSHGRNEVSAYPWGAHYVPLPGTDADLVRELFEELGVIERYDSHGLPIYNEYFLCAEPEERLYINGRWQEGIIPSHGLGDNDRKQMQDFLAHAETLKKRRGRDGKRAFTIPVDKSSRDPEFLALDRITMDDYLKKHGWNSAALNWYVDYCCRDDFGRGKAFVSAWAGLHYFASRDGRAGNADSDNVLTWPEGNGWLVDRLLEKSADKIRTGAMATAIENLRDGVSVKFTAGGKSYEIEAEHAIFAGPRFVAKHVIPGLPEAPEMVYAPWMVANITVDSLPEKTAGIGLAWDNVSYYSRSLGYIVSTHQNLGLHPRESVFTYYLPLDEQDPKNARLKARDVSHAEWSERILADLERHHKGIRRAVKNIDVMIWGHAMISPERGFLWSPARARLSESFGRIHFAHSDMSGISIFEEAQYRGVQAAEKILHNEWNRA